MDTVSIPAFERLAAIAARVLDTDIATVSFIEAATRWHAALLGCTAAEADHVCAFADVAVRGADLLVIPDTIRDPRFSGMAIVTGQRRIRFYAGAPIVMADGTCAGVISVLSDAPRPGLSGEERATLHDLAAIAVGLLSTARGADRSRPASEQTQAAEFLRKVLAGTTMGDGFATLLSAAITRFGAQSGRLWKRIDVSRFEEVSYRVQPGHEAIPVPGRSRQLSPAVQAALAGGKRLISRIDVSADDPLAVVMQAEGTTRAILLPTAIGENQFALVMTFGAGSGTLDGVADELARLLDSVAPALHDSAANEAKTIDPALRKAAEREARERDASFRLMFEDNPLPMLLYDPVGLRIIQVNHAVATTYGYSQDEFTRLSILDLLPEEDRAEARAFVSQLYDQPANSAWTFMRANGERLRVQVITHPLTISGNRQRLAVIWDVTEVEYARDALRQSNQELLVLAGQLQARTAELTEVNRRARLGMWRMPPDGGPAEWSDEMFEIFGLPSETPGPDFNVMLGWVAPGDRTRVQDIVRRAAEQRTAHSFEFRAVQPDGSIRHCLADLRPEFGFGNRLIALKGFCQDVTERKETELALLRSEKLKTIGQFTGGVAHDFNNLLTVMMLNVEEAIDSIAADHPLQVLLGPVLHAAVRGSELTAQLLSYARRSPLEPMHVSLHDLFDGLNPLLDRILGDRFTLEMHHAEGAVQPFVDAAKLENALLNLVINARDAMAAGGQIVIRTAVETLGPRDAGNWTDFLPGQYAVISVSDSGCGIPADVFPRVFEPFFTTKAVGKGSGLGLSMVYGFAKQSGGHVAISSAVSVGTTATLYLPLHGSQEVAAPRGPRPTSRAIAQRLVALLVEDQPDVLETVQRQLLSLGFKVIVAADAARAMDHITANSMIDLLFSDVAIPGPIDGTELAAIARQRHPEIRVLLTSGYLDYTGSHATELAAGMEFLQKPYSRIELAERLAAMFPAVELDGK